MKNNWKRTAGRTAAVVLGTALLVCGCAKEESGGEGAGPAKEQKLTKEAIREIRLGMLNPAAYGNVEDLDLEPGTYLSVIGKEASGDYWEAVRAGAKQAVEDINSRLGYKGDDKVKMVYSGPGDSGDVDEQVNILDEELARYPDALAISIVDSKSCDVQFDLAAENGIPVVIYDSASDYQNVMAKISTDNQKAAAEAADRMAEAMGEKGEVMILIHDGKSTTSLERAEAFADRMKEKHPEVKVGNQYRLDELDELKKAIADEINAGTYAKAGEKAEKREDEERKAKPEEISNEEAIDFIFSRNPEITAIYGTGGEAVMTAAENCERLGKKDMVIAGFDATEEEVDALNDGKISGLIAQNPYGMGYAGVVACARSVLALGNEAEVDAGYVWVDQETIKENRVQAMLY